MCQRRMCRDVHDLLRRNPQTHGFSTETMQFLAQDPAKEKCRLVSVEVETLIFGTYRPQVTIAARENTALNSAF